MMKIRLTYFNFPFWRAETSRLALHIGGVEFEDVRLGGDEFREKKAAGVFPYGQLPVLEVDGEMIAQSVAIAKFCGKVSGLYPKDDLEAAKVDELLDAAGQMTSLVNPSLREKDPEKRAAMREELGKETFPHWLGLLEKRMGEGEYLVGDSLTVADLAIWRLLGWLCGGVLDGIPNDLLKSHSRLDAHFKRIDGREDIRAWMQKHYG
jgi:glutathione S-transferase